MRMQMTNIFLKNIKEALVAENLTARCRVAHDQPPTFTTAKRPLPQMHLGVGVSDRFWPFPACQGHEACRSDSLLMTGKVECKWVVKSKQLSTHAIAPAA